MSGTAGPPRSLSPGRGGGAEVSEHEGVELREQHLDAPPVLPVEGMLHGESGPGSRKFGASERGREGRADLHEVCRWWIGTVIASLLLATLWLQFFRRGPLEAVLRRICG